jgi:hypothetical protein
MGYKRVDQNQWETEAQFQERMNGIMALHIAMMQTNLQPCTFDSFS